MFAGIVLRFRSMSYK